MLAARGKGILNDFSAIGATGLGLPAQISALRGAWPWLELKIDQTETLWPAVSMAHVMWFGSLRLVLA